MWAGISQGRTFGSTTPQIALSGASKSSILDRKPLPRFRCTRLPCRIVGRIVVTPKSTISLHQLQTYFTVSASHGEPKPTARLTHGWWEQTNVVVLPIKNSPLSSQKDLPEHTLTIAKLDNFFNPMGFKRPRVRKIFLGERKNRRNLFQTF